MDSTPRHSVSVAAVIRNDEGQVLVIKRRDTGSWEIPGGVLELGESIHDGLCREVLEETGIVIVPRSLTGIYKNLPRQVVALVFRADVASGTPSTTDEASDIEWWPVNRLSERMSEAFAVRVMDAIEPGEPAIRLHDGSSVIG
jgi:8-oxo-dGTP diphosphatase